MSLNDGSEAIRRQASFLGFGFERGNSKVGKWETWVWFSTFPRPAGAVGMWESRSDFQGLWEERETWVRFSSLSIARHFHGPPRFLHALR
jgi:hypothetical protein